MTKREIAESLGISIDAVSRWADKFVDWLGFDSRYIDKIHDEKDYTIFRIINEIDFQLDDDCSFFERITTIERKLWSLPIAMSIRQHRKNEKAQPEIARWGLISIHGFSLRREHEWLAPFRSYVDSIADFGCWATEGDICSEPFALLWTLNASQIVVIEKNPDYVHNAQEWLESTRENYPFFKAYNVTFVQGDMTNSADTKRYEGKFELAFCHNVLYYMQNDNDEMQKAINTMKSVLKSGGWLIAIEEKIDVKYNSTSVKITSGVTMPRQIPKNEHTDISHLFESEEWERVDLPNAPEWSYCYRKN